MYKRKRSIQSSFNNTVYLRRYIDDMFIAWTKDTLTLDEMLTTSNSINNAPKFTVEIPEDNCLPFLDTMVTFHPHNGHFSTKLYMKPIHSQCITPWDSHGPISQKRGILIGEIRRQPRSQGLSSLPPLSLRKDPGCVWSRVSQNLGDSPNVC